MLKELWCYRVELTPTNFARDTAKVKAGDTYVKVDGGAVYVVASDLKEVASGFPDALEIVRVGPALNLWDLNQMGAS